MAHSDQSPEHSRPSGLEPVTGVFSLVTDEGVDHLVSPSDGQEFLQLAEGVAYPRDTSSYSVLGEVVLRQVDQNLFALPAEYITVQHALNEATGAAGQMLGDPESSRAQAGQSAFEEVFRGIAQTVSKLAKADGIMPDRLDYRNLILEQTQEGGGVVFLPPVDFAPTSPGDLKKSMRHLRSQFAGGLFENADTLTQRLLLAHGLAIFDETIEGGQK